MACVREDEEGERAQRLQRGGDGDHGAGRARGGQGPGLWTRVEGAAEFVLAQDELLEHTELGKLGGFIGDAVKKAAEASGPRAKDAWRETVELTKVVVPSVPKLVEGSVSKVGSGGLNGKVEKKADPAPEAKVAKVAKATEATQQQKVIVTKEVTTTTETVETKSASSETSASLEESGTVWKKKKTSD